MRLGMHGLGLGLLAAILGWPLVTFPSERDPLPYAASIEVLGRSIVYGPQADYLLSSRWAIGGGIAKVSGSGPQGAIPPATALIPLFANYYLSPFHNSWFLTGGFSVVTNPGEVKGLTALLGTLRFSSFPLLPDFGFGYEIRQKNGFLFRVNGLLYLGENLAPAEGFSLGYAF